MCGSYQQKSLSAHSELLPCVRWANPTSSLISTYCPRTLMDVANPAQTCPILHILAHSAMPNYRRPCHSIHREAACRRRRSLPWPRSAGWSYLEEVACHWEPRPSSPVFHQCTRPFSPDLARRSVGPKQSHTGQDDSAYPEFGCPGLDAFAAHDGTPSGGTSGSLGPRSRSLQCQSHRRSARKRALEVEAKRQAKCLQHRGRGSWLSEPLCRGPGSVC